jgi:hypothetical protein
VGVAIAIKILPQQIAFVQETDVLDRLCSLFEYEEKRCQVLFLPAYSPDFSPIEEAIGQAQLTVTIQAAHVWFRHCGYLPPQERQS